MKQYQSVLTANQMADYASRLSELTDIIDLESRILSKSVRDFRKLPGP